MEVLCRGFWVEVRVGKMGERWGDSWGDKAEGARAPKMAGCLGAERAMSH